MEGLSRDWRFYTSYGLNWLAQYEASTAPSSRSSTSPSSVHFHELGSGSVCAMNVPNYYEECSVRAPRPIIQPEGVC